MLNTDRTTQSLFLAAIVLIAPGCSLVRMPGKDDFKNRIADPSMALSAVGSADTYMKVRQARAQNSVVLQVTDDESAARILPLPAQGQSVFVSTLLEQTGVIKKLGGIQATLYRSSVDSINGLRMNVAMTSDGKRVRPESDYALQAGDRIRVSKREVNLLETLLGVAM